MSLCEDEPALLQESANLLSWSDALEGDFGRRRFRADVGAVQRAHESLEHAPRAWSVSCGGARAWKAAFATGLLGTLALCLASRAGVRSARWPHSSEAVLSDKVELASEEAADQWQVMYEGFVNVRQTRSLSALILNKHWKCEIVEGSPQGGWVKLAHEPGYIKINLPPYVLLRPVPRYRLVSSGTCSTYGMHPIRGAMVCLQAASALGLVAPDFQRTMQIPSPEGCFLDGGKLFLSTAAANNGNGVVGPMEPLCISIQAAPEDYAPCEPISGHEPPPTTTVEMLLPEAPSTTETTTTETTTEEPTTTAEPTTTTTEAPTTTTTEAPTTTTTEAPTTTTEAPTTTIEAKTTEMPKRLAATTTTETTTTTTTTTVTTTTTEPTTVTETTTTATATTLTTTTTTAPPTTTVTTITLTTTVETTTTTTEDTTTTVHWKFPSLFCFEVTTVKPHEPDWYEPKLVKVQLQQRVSIFQCDEFTVFTNGGKIVLGGNWTPAELKTPTVGMGDLSKQGQTTNSWLNTVIFQMAWEHVMWDGRYKKHDWTVKVDPDAVFFPDRLRDLVRPHSKPAGAWFFLNCNRYPPSPPGEAKLYGSVEVFSRKAVEAYVAGKERCISDLDWRGWGEDFYMQRCMQKLNVMAIYNFGWIGDDRCWPAKCSATDRVAFHDFKDIDRWFDCWGMSTEAR